MPTKRALIPTEKSWRAAQRALWRRRARLGQPWAAKWPSEPRAAFLRQEPAAGSLCKMAARTLSASRSFPSFGTLFSASTAAAQHRLGPRRLPAGNTRSPGPAALFAEAKGLGRGRNARSWRFLMPNSHRHRGVCTAHRPRLDGREEGGPGWGVQRPSSLAQAWPPLRPTPAQRELPLMPVPRPARR